MKNRKRNATQGSHYSLYHAVSGWGAVVAGEDGLLEVFLPFEEGTREELVARVKAEYPGVAEAKEGSTAHEAAARLRDYFAGEEVSFSDLPLDLGPMTSFQQKVYRVVSSIPPGKVMTYAEVASAVGSPRGARGIGSAMGRNRLPVVIPCHRVVGSSGAMTGYTAPGGVQSKKWLLRLEGITFSERGRVVVKGAAACR